MERAVINERWVLEGHEQLGHSTQLGVCLDTTAYVRRNDIPGHIEDGVDLFHHVNVDLVGVVLYAGSSPGHVADSTGR